MRVLSRIRNAIIRTISFVRLYAQHLPLALRMIFDPRCSAMLLKGKTRKEELPVTVLYVGRKHNDTYILNVIFSSFETAVEKKTTLWSFRRAVRQLQPEADLTLYDIGWPYHGWINRHGEFLEMPDWVNMSIYLGDTWEETRQQFHHTLRRQDLRHIRIQDYRPDYTSDPRDIADFYERMFMPFMKSKHGAAMVKANKGQMIRRGKKGALLRILQEDRVVAGGIVFPEDDVLYFLWIGMAPDCLENPPKAIISAVYYFGIQYAQELGCDVVDFTGTRAFFGDGAYRFKRKWGAGISDTFSPSSILLKPACGNETAARFCQQFPMLVRRQSGPEWLFLSLDRPVDEAYVKNAYGLFECDGVSRLSVLDLSGRSSDLSGLDLEALNARVDKATLENFADHYRKERPD